MSKTEKSLGLKFLFLGLLVFLTLGMDLFVIPIDRLLWGNQLKIDTFFSSPWYVLITHWSIVIILWIMGGFLIFKWLKKKDFLEEVISINWNKDLIYFIIIAIIAGILFNVVESIIFSTQLPQFFREYQRFYQVHGSMGLIVWLFQNIYYLIESMLVVLLLALMQRAGEIWFKNDRFPYGGMGLLITWGISHLMHGLISGLWICAFSISFGLLFIKAEKRWWPSLLFVWLMFII